MEHQDEDFLDEANKNCVAPSAPPDDNMYVSCEFCGKDILMDQEAITVHESGCRPDLCSLPSAVSDEHKLRKSAHEAHSYSDQASALQRERRYLEKPEGKKLTPDDVSCKADSHNYMKNFKNRYDTQGDISYQENFEVKHTKGNLGSEINDIKRSCDKYGIEDVNTWDYEESSRLKCLEKKFTNKYSTTESYNEYPENVLRSQVNNEIKEGSDVYEARSYLSRSKMFTEPGELLKNNLDCKQESAALIGIAGAVKSFFRDSEKTNPSHSKDSQANLYPADANYNENCVAPSAPPDEDVYVSCELCGKDILMDQEAITVHESGCRPDLCSLPSAVSDEHKLRKFAHEAYSYNDQTSALQRERRYLEKPEGKKLTPDDVSCKADSHNYMKNFKNRYDTQRDISYQENLEVKRTKGNLGSEINDIKRSCDKYGIEDVNTWAYKESSRSKCLEKKYTSKYSTTESNNEYPENVLRSQENNEIKEGSDVYEAKSYLSRSKISQEPGEFLENNLDCKQILEQSRRIKIQKSLVLLIELQEQLKKFFMVLKKQALAILWIHKQTCILLMLTIMENDAFTFGSSNKEKNVEEEKLNFKYSPNPFLNDKDPKYIQNDITGGDNEENESLEEFWKRADIKLVQRLRLLQKNSPNY